VTTAGDDAARNFGLDGQALHEVRYARAAEFVDVVTKLWDSWEDKVALRRQTDPLVVPASTYRASLCRLMCKEAHMATNLAIDPDLLERALEVSGERTKKAAVTRALQEFIARREQARILGLFGTVEIDSEYDYKAERSRG
jgi:alkanesulfonate monooxygenase SsuD/methylene tetrahydromethanopterin reductase-like flavin-dependent oxidoreductase (luciferase family)